MSKSHKDNADNLKTILKINYKLFSIKPILFISYFIMILIWAVSPFITSYIIGKMFDILEKGMMRDYYFLTCIFFGINMFSIYIMKKAGVVDALITFFVGKAIKENIVKQLLKSDSNINIGEILDILSYDVEIMEYMLQTQLELLSQCLFLIGSTIVLMYINFKITMFIIIPLIIASVLYWRWCNIYKEKHRKARKENINYSIRLSEFINNRESIQFLANNKIFNEFRRVNKNKNRVLLDKVKQNVLMNTVTELIKHVGIILILLFFLANSNNTNLTVGNMIFFISYIGYAGGWLQLFNTTASIIKSGENTLERISEITNCSVGETVNLLIGKVENDAVNDGVNSGLIFKRFRLSKKDRFHDIILQAGDMLGITGDTGSGKTKFVDSIMGYSDYEGTVSFDGNDKGKIGYVSQEIHLFDASVEDNITIFNKMDKDKYDEVCYIANIDDAMMRGTSNIGVNGKELSEGQRQRVAIARALYNNNGIVILDDAFAYLDKDNRKSIMNKLSQCKNLIVIFVTGDTQLLNKANSIIDMKDMKINIISGNN
ncbi:MAG: ABC transporter ATP-binding protein [Eubacteriales bacterium]|nr:ABC transporter ATP-binding protein [Eubacteriales bacterium]